jgi:DNA mismatch repair protein MutS2
MGMMRSLVNIKDLEITKTAKDVKRENQRNESRNRGRTAINKSASIRPETVDEAIAQLDKYIDDACLANLAQITVVHGKGTGALRKGLHNYFKQLKKQKRISGYRDGEYGEGDLGVTVVIL